MIINLAAIDFDSAIILSASQLKPRPLLFAVYVILKVHVAYSDSSESELVAGNGTVLNPARDSLGAYLELFGRLLNG